MRPIFVIQSTIWNRDLSTACYGCTVCRIRGWNLWYIRFRSGEDYEVENDGLGRREGTFTKKSPGVVVVHADSLLDFLVICLLEVLVP